MTYHLMFANAKMETQFRKICASQHEVGGWLFADMASVRGLHRGRIKAAFGLPRYPSVNVITSWLLVPNVSRTPHREWTPQVDTSVLNNIVNLTTHGTTTYPIHFHTHPGYDITPSRGDLNYWLHHCEWIKTKKEQISHAVIVGSAMFNWGVYEVSYDISQNPSPFHFNTTRKLLSWRDRRMRWAVAS